MNLQEARDMMPEKIVAMFERKGRSMLIASGQRISTGFHRSRGWLQGACLALVCTILCQAVWGGAAERSLVTDVRELLLREAQRSDPDHPDGRNVLMTHFSYVGRLDTQDGRIYVANRRAVLGGMSAPRGVNDILFFDRHCRFLGKVNYAMSMPLWCEGGKLYLFGDLDGHARPGEGNVIALSQGFAHLSVSHEKKYASSGGTLDE